MIEPMFLSVFTFIIFIPTCSFESMVIFFNIAFLNKLCAWLSGYGSGLSTTVRVRFLASAREMVCYYPGGQVGCLRVLRFLVTVKPQKRLDQRRQRETF